ncbi:extracellular solute-binding protein [Paenibacillus sp. J5C_2022]|uniref:extracellular solute-binding protein n=1 Tax=Paenibacillus sp. J5C2022 TaxID=2977129 RepID=UPI0021D121B0|nr:extracellular solute-binding protein [Paenibacillus sp. J5C2022]MCU6709158.1 extracellular solute-binding protein [Paenibacillus sp. J5C2022]
MKKWMSGLIVLALMMLCVACSNGDNGDNGSNEKGGAKEDQTDTGQAATAAPEETVKIEVERWFSVTVDPPEPGNDAILQQIKKDLNIDLQYAFTSGKSDEWRAKLGARIAASDLPEAILFFNMKDYVKAQMEGYLMPLNDVLTLDNLPSNMGYINKEMLFSISDSDGNYHGIPSRPPSVTNSLFIRKDWLDKLELPMPQTTEELREVMLAFAHDDPDGNGKKDTFGFSAPGSSMTNQVFWQLLSSFTGDVRGTYWVDEAGKLAGGPTSDGMRQYLQYMQDLMKEGAIDPDMATNNLDRVTQKIEQGQVGIFFHAGYPASIVDNMKAINPDAETVILPPVTGPAGRASNNAKTYAPNGVLGVTMKLKDDPAKVQKIIDLLNWMNGGIGEELLTFGVEGVNHKRENGKVTEFLPGKQSNYLPAYSLIGETALKTKPESVQAFYPDPFLYEQQMLLLGDKPERGSVFTMGYAKEPIEYAADLNKYVNEMMMKFIYANVALDDSSWADYVKTYMETYKGQRYVDAVTEQLEQNGVLK